MYWTSEAKIIIVAKGFNSITEWPDRQLSEFTKVPAWTCHVYPTLLAMAEIDAEFPQPHGTEITHLDAVVCPQY